MGAENINRGNLPGYLVPGTAVKKEFELVPPFLVRGGRSTLPVYLEVLYVRLPRARAEEDEVPTVWNERATSRARPPLLWCRPLKNDVFAISSARTATVGSYRKTQWLRTWDFEPPLPHDDVIS